MFKKIVKFANDIFDTLFPNLKQLDADLDKASALGRTIDKEYENNANGVNNVSIIENYKVLRSLCKRKKWDIDLFLENASVVKSFVNDFSWDNDYSEDIRNALHPKFGENAPINN